MVFDDYDKERLFEMIYAGLVTAKKLPKQLFQLTFKELLKGMETAINYDVVDKKLVADLTQNLYLFSGAKTEVQVLDMVGSMVKDGKLLPYNEFKKIADEKFTEYNKNYLRTEYDTAVGQSQMVSDWSDIHKDKKLFPYLKYDAILDSKTSDICKHFDGVTLPVDDKFWSQYSPLNHFNCFTPDTPILTPNGWVNIEDIKKGDLVIGGSGKTQNVLGVHIKSIYEEILNIRIKNNSISTTKKHRFLSINGWKKAESFNVGDIIVQNIETTFFNKAICTINNFYVVLSYLCMPIIRKWKTRTINTFNCYINTWNKNINKSIIDKFVSNTSQTFINKIIKKFLFVISKFFMILSIPFWIVIICFNSLFIRFFSNFNIEHRVKFFHSFKSIRSFFAFHWMRNCFKSFNKSFSSFNFSNIVINPLSFYSFATNTTNKPLIFKPSSYGSGVNAPSNPDSSKSHHSVEVESLEGFTKGQPLDRFNSLFSFFFHSFFNRKFVLIKNISKNNYSGQIYNLSVNNDESYITNVGVVHNCRCEIIKLSEYDEFDITKEKNVKLAEKKGGDNMNDIFKMNPYNDRVIFSEKHPYFEQAKNYKKQFVK